MPAAKCGISYAVPWSSLCSMQQVLKLKTPPELKDWIEDSRPLCYLLVSGELTQKDENESAEVSSNRKQHIALALSFSVRIL